MKNILKRIAAAAGAGLILSAAAVPTAFAESETEKLPSGLTVEDLGFKLDNLLGDKETTGSANFASAEIGVFKGDEVLLTKYYGDIDIENEIPADENSVYEWGSISKTFVWVSAMQLWEQGRLDLEKDVRDYLPEGFFQHLSYDEPITMMDLMNHSAGWCETTRPIETKAESEVLPLKEALQAIEPAQIYPPGEHYTYSNYGAAVAGYVIECVSGMDYCKYVHKNILEPLGMEHTAIDPTHSDCKFVYENRPKTKSYQFFMDEPLGLGTRLHYISAYPAGAVTGTLADLMTYAQAFVDDSAPLFKSKATQEKLFEGTSFYGESDIPMNSHGFWNEEYAVRVVGHNGATNAGQANMIFDRESKTGLCVLVNQPRGNDYLSASPSLVFGKLSTDTYGSENAATHALDGYWLSTRGIYRGMFSYMPYLSAFSGRSMGSIESSGSGLVQAVEGEGESRSAMLLGEVTDESGNITAIQTPSTDYIPDRFYIAKIILLTAYIITAVAAFYLIRIRIKKLRTKRWKRYAGSGAMLAGESASIISVVLFVTAFVMGSNSYGGLDLTATTIIGIAQMLCIAACGAAMIAAAAAFFSKKAKASPYRYIGSLAGNALCIGAITYFQLYRFWGC